MRGDRQEGGASSCPGREGEQDRWKCPLASRGHQENRISSLAVLCAWLRAACGRCSRGTNAADGLGAAVGDLVTLHPVVVRPILPSHQCHPSYIKGQGPVFDPLAALGYERRAPRIFIFFKRTPSFL